jgi:F0F1-type ATP synthase membrane subunit b/b'
MSQPPSSDLPADSNLETKLQSIAQLLREADHLGPEAQQALAEIVDELGKALRSVPVSSEEAKSLADSTAHLVRAVHQKHDPGLVAAAQGRMRQAITRVENQAPFVAQIAGRLLDTLVSLGI